MISGERHSLSGTLPYRWRSRSSRFSRSPISLMLIRARLVSGILKYAVFVLFFPQLIAGPIVHHSEMLPQFDREKTNVTYCKIFVSVCRYFSLVCSRRSVSPIRWPTMQTRSLRRDSREKASNFSPRGPALSHIPFSSISIFQAILSGGRFARMFGIVLPVNFFSPYKAVNIIDFWRQWHMTLSRFLRDYIYIPLGGNSGGRRDAISI